ncbi:unnamed protein product [Phyllotreta striolata]|uniref:Cytochrome P450 n=1 Tax=Phyllotreta striolata TaxID=444603 RepID=A0A9N9TQV6_PHYSR|nr:unnamed protein product [Phyllotreta striolata]
MLLILFILVVSLLYYLIQRNYNYWSDRGVPGPKPSFLVGNFGKSFIGKISSGDIITNTYREYENYPFVGIYKAITPVLIIRDPEMVKNVMVKDFKNFHDNDIEVQKDLDPIFGRNPFVMRGAEWKQKRVQLTGCFTSGKIKGMFPYMEHNLKGMMKYMENAANTSTPLEALDLCMRYTLDNVAICAFGVDGKAFEEHSAFKELAEKFFTADSLPKKLKFWLMFNFPVISGLIKLKFIPKDVENHLIEMVSNTLKYRKENNVTRNDFLDVCSRMSTEGEAFTDIDIVAHAASFFADGYDTSARVMSFLLFELASNPEVQQTLREELNESYIKNGNKFTYEALHDLPYLDACINEGLRKNFIAANLSKLCTEDYTYTSTSPNFKQMTVKLKAGDRVAIPVMGLHHDPKYFDDPEKFKPERFLKKENIQSFTHLPFGEGPRICIGQRFGVTQVKVGLAYVIRNFQCTVNSKTQLPLKFDPYFPMILAVGGLWLDFKKCE